MQAFNKQRTGRSSPLIPSKRSADTQEEAWVADEDRFVLQQAKKKAEIRVKGGRARPIDWFAVTLRFTDATRNPLDDEISDAELDIVDPEGVFEILDDAQLAELDKDIDMYLALETDRKNREFWNTMKLICQDRRRSSQSMSRAGRGVNSINADVDRILSPKTYEELETLEAQVRKKLHSDEPIDVDYWEHLLRSLLVWKAKAKLRSVSQTIVQSRRESLQLHQRRNASAVREKLQTMLSSHSGATASSASESEERAVSYEPSLDPAPSLKLKAEDKTCQVTEEGVFLNDIDSERKKTFKLGFVPLRQSHSDTLAGGNGTGVPPEGAGSTDQVPTTSSDDFSQATKTLYDREVARGVNDDEEIFTGEEDVGSSNKPQWANKYRPRKPKYFNRVQMGYEWNKYNQTHYDHENPPPKVVQGYKFNIFYPDLIDRTRAPTYRIEREHGRKRGQSFAPAGEEDTCLIRFMAGPPYEDIAFRIVDREWDYSAKRERGFKSSFDKGILQLHFQFKKVYYRK